MIQTNEGVKKMKKEVINKSDALSLASPSCLYSEGGRDV